MTRVRAEELLRACGVDYDLASVSGGDVSVHLASTFDLTFGVLSRLSAAFGTRVIDVCCDSGATCSSHYRTIKIRLPAGGRTEVSFSSGVVPPMACSVVLVGAGSPAGDGERFVADHLRLSRESADRFCVTSVRRSTPAGEEVARYALEADGEVLLLSGVELLAGDVLRLMVRNLSDRDAVFEGILVGSVVRLDESPG